MALQSRMPNKAINSDRPPRHLNCAFASLNIAQFKCRSGLPVICDVMFNQKPNGKGDRFI